MFLISIVANGLVLTGIVILLGSLPVVKRIARRLPAGRSRKRWYAMAGLIVLFVLGYLGYITIVANEHVAVTDLIVPGIFFFGACFVWFSTFIALQTTLDVMRISVLEHETLTDPLTGIYNRRFLEKRLAEEISKARRYGFELSLLLFDLDHFKRINDEYGHQVGDRMLAEIGRLAAEQLRDSDILARYGGEEFVVIAPGTDRAEATRLAERLRAHVESHGFLQNDDAIGATELEMTISIGVAGFEGNDDSAEALIGRADQNLYQAKRGGRNRVGGESVPG